MHQSVATVAKDLPQLSHSREERLRQCLIMAGAENLPDSELLEVILFTSNRGKNVEPLVEKLLKLYREHPDAGIHGAIDWLLRHVKEGPDDRKLDWGQRKELERIEAELKQRDRAVARGGREPLRH